MIRKSLLTLTLSLCTALVLTGSGFAQTKSVQGDHQGHHRAQHGQRFAALGLSDQQKAQIKAILEQAHAHKKTLRANDNQTVGELKAKMKQIHEETRTRVSAVLTPAQREKLTQMKKAHGGKAAGRKGHDKTKKNIPPA